MSESETRISCILTERMLDEVANGPDNHEPSNTHVDEPIRTDISCEAIGGINRQYPTCRNSSVGFSRSLSIVIAFGRVARMPVDRILGEAQVVARMKRISELTAQRYRNSPLSSWLLRMQSNQLNTWHAVQPDWVILYSQSRQACIHAVQRFSPV